MMNEALEGQPFCLRIIQSWSDSILLSILNDFKLEDIFENQLISQRQLYFFGNFVYFRRVQTSFTLVDEEHLQALQQSLQHYFEDVLN